MSESRRKVGRAARWVIGVVVLLSLLTAIGAAMSNRGPQLSYLRGVKPTGEWDVGTYSIREFHVREDARELARSTEDQLAPLGWKKTTWSTGKNPVVPFGVAFHGPNPRESVTVEAVPEMDGAFTKVTVFNEISPGERLRRRFAGVLPR